MSKLMNRALMLVLAIAIAYVLVPTEASAEGVIDYEQLYTTKDLADGEVQITGVNTEYFATLDDSVKINLTLEIPATIEGKNVVSIYSDTLGRSILYGISSESITTMIDMSQASHLTEIGAYAFSYSEARSVLFPTSETYAGGTLYMDKQVFYKNTELTSITIPAYVRFKNEPSYEVQGSGTVFQECSKLEEVTFESDSNPTTGLTIPYGTFAKCGALKTVNLPSHLEGISRYGFYNSPVESIHFADTCNAPSGEVTIGSLAFNGHASKTVTIPAYVTKIYDSAFDSSALKTVYVEYEITGLRDYPNYAGDWISNAIPIIVSETSYNQIQELTDTWVGMDLYYNATFVCEVTFDDLDDATTNVVEDKLYSKSFQYVKTDTDDKNGNADIWVKDTSYEFPAAPESSEGWTFVEGQETAIDTADDVTALVVYPAKPLVDKYMYFGEYPQTFVDTIYGFDDTVDDTVLFRISPEGEGFYSIFEYDPIKWIIMDRVVNEDGTTTYRLLSDDTLITREYHNEEVSTTWEDSTLRAWLNGEEASDTDFSKAPGFEEEPFYASAFNDFQKSLIIPTHIENSDMDIEEYGLDDYVYILAYTDEEIGVIDEADMKPEYSGYADQTSSTMGSSYPYWWLRTNYYSGGQVVIKNSDGSAAGLPLSLFTNTTVGVRPAITITVPTNYTLVNDGSDATPYMLEEIFTVTYTDGVEDVEVFGDQVVSGIQYGAETPAYDGKPVREGYKFLGWNPGQAETVTESIIYTAVWEKIIEEDKDDATTKPDVNPNIDTDSETGTGDGAVNTGDASTLMVWLLLLVGSGMVWMPMAMRKRR